jgi:HK97 gp10 family phage protein
VPFKIKAELVGVREAMARLEGMKPGKIRRVHRKAINEITKGVLRTAKGLVPKRTGQLRKSLGRKVKTYPSGVTVGVVGPRNGFLIVKDGKRINPVKYAHLVELGTRHSPPKSFLRAAWDSHRSAMASIAAKVVEAELAKLKK